MIGREIRGLEVLADGLDHPEGVAVGADGALYAGGEGGQVYRVEPGVPGAEELARFDGRSFLGVTADAAGGLLLCDITAGELVRFDPSNGELATWCAAASGTALTCPNWSALATDGSLWLTDSGAIDAADGSIVRVPAAGGDGTRLPLGPLHYPNGCALGSAGELYVAESTLPGVSVVRDGRREELVRFDRAVPDGLAVCADGTLIVACFQPNALLRIDPRDPAASLEVVAEDWTGLGLLTPTNVAFFGPDLDRMAIATVCGWSLTALSVPFSGRPLELMTLQEMSS